MATARKRLYKPIKKKSLGKSAPVTNVITSKGLQAEIKKRAKQKLALEAMMKKLCRDDFASAWKSTNKVRVTIVRSHGLIIGVILHKITKAEFREEWLRDRSNCSTYI